MRICSLKFASKAEAQRWYKRTIAPGSVYQCNNWLRPLDKGRKTCHTKGIPNKENHVNVSTLATATKLELAIAEAQGKVKVTRLAPAKPKRNQLIYTSGVVQAGRNSGRSQKVG